MAKLSLFERRRRRVRSALRSVSGGKPRLSVHRTGKHIYAQIIDDAAGKTVAAASTLGAKGSGANVDAAKKVGSDIAAAAKKASYGEVVKVDLRAERIAKREAEGGEPPSLFGF